MKTAHVSTATMLLEIGSLRLFRALQITLME
jgi:hypothetical protein